MEKNPVQFHMGPQLSNKPNKQGTLFHAQSKTPRGYSPQRMREVSSNLGAVHTPAPLSGESHPFAGPEGAAKARETLARSRMPAKDMKGANVIVRSRSAVPANQSNKNVGGIYRPNANGTSGNVSLYANKDHSEKYGPASGEDKKRAKQNAEITLLHEMGHHASSMRGDASSTIETEKKRGIQEGLADHVAQQTYVPDKRDGKFDVAERQSHNSYAPMLHHHSSDFQAGYTAMRNRLTQPAQFPSNNPQHEQGKLF